MVPGAPDRKGRRLLRGLGCSTYVYAAVASVVILALGHVYHERLKGTIHGGEKASLARGRESLFMGTCPEGWVLPQIGPAMRDQVEEVAGRWYRDLPTTLRKAYNVASQMKEMGGPVTEPAEHKRFDVIMPVVDACPNLSKVGSEGDGGKLICGLDEIIDTPSNPCVVYSIGGNNQWDFEADIVRRTRSCRVFTFDCTIDGHVPSDLQDRVEYHKICLGTRTAGGEEDSDWTFMRLSEIMAMLGHDHITLLKMDIVRRCGVVPCLDDEGPNSIVNLSHTPSPPNPRQEGYEWDVFHEILSEQNINLPEQISFELHYLTQMQGLDWWGRKRTAGELTLFSRRLYEAGYRLVSREDNPHCDHCTELTAVRFQCPAML